MINWCKNLSNRHANKFLVCWKREGVMFKKSTTLIAVGAMMLLMLAACEQSVPQTVEVTRIVTQVVPQTIVVTEVVQIVVTPTSEPATPTSEPSPTLAFQEWTLEQVVQAFRAAGLEMENPRPMTKDDYGMAPMRAVEATRFLIPSLCPDCGGRIFNFSTQEDLEITKSYYEELGKSSASFFSWLFVKDNILVQINGDLHEELARKYQEALSTLK